MAVGSVINATDYNNIRTLIDSIIGTGSSGYGRTLVSAAKSPTDLIQSTDVINLFLDCQSGFNHQNQAISNSVNVQTLDPGDTIFWSHFGDSGDVQGLYDIANSVNNFQTQVNNGSTDFASGSFTLQTSSATRTTAWNDTIEHTERYTWASDTARDYWFNAGGSVKFSGTLSGGQSGVAGSKDKDWQDLLSDIGTITFKKVGLNYVTSSSASVGSGSSWNEAQLEAGSERLLYQKYGGGINSVYNDNLLEIKGQFLTTSNFIMKIRFRDLDVGTDPIHGDPIDENVTGTLISQQSYLTPSSTFQVTYTGGSPTTIQGIVQTAPSIFRQDDL